MTLAQLHPILGWTTIVLNAAAGSWALGAHWAEGLRGRALWIFTAVAEVTIIIQVVIGVAYMNTSGIEVSGLHQAYGFMAVFAVAIIYSYRQQIHQWIYLLYGFGGLFIMGLGLRAAFLG